MGNKPSTPKKRLNYLKNHPSRSQTPSQNRSFENPPDKKFRNENTAAKSVSPIRTNDLVPNKLNKFEEKRQNIPRIQTEKPFNTSKTFLPTAIVSERRVIDRKQIVKKIFISCLF